MTRPDVTIVLRAAHALVLAALLTACSSAQPSALDPASVPATATAGASRSLSPTPTAFPSGASIVGRIDYPADGEVIWQSGMLWVEDRENQVLSQIDTANMAIVRHVDGVLGGYMTFQDGIVWMSSFVLDSLLRIDPDSGDVKMLDTGPGQAGTTSVVGTSRGVWVANHELGTIALVDAAGKVVQDVKVSRPNIQGPQALTTDGENVWVSVPEDLAVVKVRITDGKVLASVKLDYTPSGALGYGDGRIWVTGGGDDGINVGVPGAAAHGRVAEIDAATAHVLRVLDFGANGSTNGRVVYAFGSLWVPQLGAETDLLRIDPKTGNVIGRLPMPSEENQSIAASEGFLWLRTVGRLFKIRPA